MGLEKAIESGKEHRKPYHDSRRFDPACRSHGGCPYCENNRLHKFKKSEPIIDEDELGYYIVNATIETN